LAQHYGYVLAQSHHMMKLPPRVLLQIILTKQAQSAAISYWFQL